MLSVVSTMTRRSEIAIVVDILKAAGECGTNKTGIVYAANLNFNRAGRYLDMLQENHLIEKSSDVFQITDSGRTYLEKASDVLALAI